MFRFDSSLLEVITKGDCILLVGSGISVGVGYPSWNGLVEIVFNGVKNELNDNEIKEYDRLWENSDSSKYLKFFDFAETKVGKEKLVNLIKDDFNKIKPIPSDVYSIISNWPINTYLTTNYDDELKKYLDKQEEIFIERGNSDDDLRTLNSSTSKTIFKIHGDFRDYHRFILTGNDYQNVKTSDEFRIWREKINSILHMRNLVIIGYSAEDPDFKQQLLRAKEIANPENPVYMFITGLEPKEIDELYIKENIRVISYNNLDRKHQQLTKLLKQYNAFIPARSNRLVGKTKENLDESEIASSLFLYNEMIFTGDDNTNITKAFENCILNILGNKSLSVTEIQNLLTDKHITFDKNNVENAVEVLSDNGFIKCENIFYSLSEKGKEFISTNKIQTNEYRERFNEYCKKFLIKTDIELVSVQKILTSLHKGLETLFRKRGLEIARNIISPEIGQQAEEITNFC